MNTNIYLWEKLEVQKTPIPAILVRIQLLGKEKPPRLSRSVSGLEQNKNELTYKAVNPPHTIEKVMPKHTALQKEKSTVLHMSFLYLQPTPFIYVNVHCCCDLLYLAQVFVLLLQ